MGGPTPVLLSRYIELSVASLNTVNSMITRLTVFAREVSRVALEVGTKGILGGVAEVEGVEGTWRELTTNVSV